MLAGSVFCPADKKQIFAVAERKAAFCSVDIHAADILRIFYRDHIGTLLIHFHEISAVLIDKRKMRCNDNFFRINRSAVSQRFCADQLRDLSMFINSKPLR